MTTTNDLPAAADSRQPCEICVPGFTAIAFTGNNTAAVNSYIALTVTSLVQAERERCATIADNYTDYWPDTGVTWGDDPDSVAAKCIAEAIRSGKDRGCDPPQAEAKGLE